MVFETTAVVVGKATVSGVVGAVIGIFREQIGNAFRPTKDKDLKGTWDCEWLIAAPTTVEANTIKDQVRITRVRGQLINGEGTTLNFGPSHFEGKATEFAVTLSYTGEGGQSTWLVWSC